MDWINKYDDGHEHEFDFSPFGAPVRCSLCGVGKDIHEYKLIKDGKKYRKIKGILRKLVNAIDSAEEAV